MAARSNNLRTTPLYLLDMVLFGFHLVCCPNVGRKDKELGRCYGIWTTFGGISISHCDPCQSLSPWDMSQHRQWWWEVQSFSKSAWPLHTVFLLPSPTAKVLAHIVYWDVRLKWRALWKAIYMLEYWAVYYCVMRMKSPKDSMERRRGSVSVTCLEMTNSILSFYLSAQNMDQMAPVRGPAMLLFLCSFLTTRLSLFLYRDNAHSWQWPCSTGELILRATLGSNKA